MYSKAISLDDKVRNEQYIYIYLLYLQKLYFVWVFYFQDRLHMPKWGTEVRLKAHHS